MRWWVGHVVEMGWNCSDVIWTFDTFCDDFDLFFVTLNISTMIHLVIMFLHILNHGITIEFKMLDYRRPDNLKQRPNQVITQTPH